MVKKKMPQKKRQRSPRKNLVKACPGLVPKYMDYGGFSRKSLADEAEVDPGSVGRASEGKWITTEVAGSIRKCLNQRVKEQHEKGTLSKTEVPLLTSLSEWPSKDGSNTGAQTIEKQETTTEVTVGKDTPEESWAYLQTLGVVGDCLVEIMRTNMHQSEAKQCVGLKDRCFWVCLSPDGSLRVKEHLYRANPPSARLELYITKAVRMVLVREMESADQWLRTERRDFWVVASPDGSIRISEFV
jgi:hypothetical protein